MDPGALTQVTRLAEQGSLLLSRLTTLLFPLLPTHTLGFVEQISEICSLLAISSVEHSVVLFSVLAVLCARSPGWLTIHSCVLYSFSNNFPLPPVLPLMNTVWPSVYMYSVYNVLISWLWGLDPVSLEKSNSGPHELETSTHIHCSLSPASPYSIGFWQHVSVRLCTSFFYALARCIWCTQGSPTPSQMIRWPLLRLNNIPLLFQYTLHFLCLSTKGQSLWVIVNEVTMILPS